MIPFPKIKVVFRSPAKYPTSNELPILPNKNTQSLSIHGDETVSFQKCQAAVQLKMKR